MHVGIRRIPTYSFPGLQRSVGDPHPPSPRCSAGEGAEHSEAGEGSPVPSTRFAPLACILSPRGVARDSYCKDIILLRYCQISKEPIISKPAGVARCSPNRGDIDAA